jgi:ABC-type cobalt transport system substrate-binding protein
MSVSDFRDELEEVWVPKDVGELEGLLLTIQNEPGKRILRHKIQQTLNERKCSKAITWERWGADHAHWEKSSG